MSEDSVIRNCSPTLAGIKTANLFSCSYPSEEEMKSDIRRMNLALNDKGLRVLPLRCNQGRTLVYVYRPALLRSDLKNAGTRAILREMGYTGRGAEQYLARLKARLDGQKDRSEFPHEIGLFLGYPPEDVIGFIENRAGGCKLSGAWKVYGDPERAQKLFDSYRQCTAAYMLQHSRGKSIRQLAVKM